MKQTNMPLRLTDNRRDVAMNREHCRHVKENYKIFKKVAAPAHSSHQEWDCWRMWKTFRKATVAVSVKGQRSTTLCYYRLNGKKQEWHISTIN